jgi:hypothetical protein
MEHGGTVPETLFEHWEHTVCVGCHERKPLLITTDAAWGSLLESEHEVDPTICAFCGPECLLLVAKKDADRYTKNGSTPWWIR